MNRFESLLLGIAAGSLGVAFVGPTKAVIGTLLVAVGSYLWRTKVKPRIS